MANNYSNLTDNEIRNLSLELKICYYLYGWNKSISPKNLDDWVTVFYYIFSDNDLRERLENNLITDAQYDSICELRAREEYNRLSNFIEKFILL